jgi:hypothetical protein
MSDNALDFLVGWFAAHCNDDWEHDTGIRIETLDNPGWAIDIRTEDTELEGVIVDWQRTEDDDTWLHWRSTGLAFEARCGPGDLQLALLSFRTFAESHARC